MENDNPRETHESLATSPFSVGVCLGWAIVTFVLDVIGGLVVILSRFDLHGGHPPGTESIPTIFLLVNFGLLAYAASKGRDAALGVFCGALFPVLITFASA